MGKRVVTLNVNDEKLKASASSKKTKINESSAQSEIQSFGIVEINNAQARAKTKNKNEIGYEKHSAEKEKKAVKSKLADVDYFDFDLTKGKKTAKVSEKVENSCEKPASMAENSKSCSKTETAKVEIVKEKSGSKVLKTGKSKADERQNNAFAEVSERVSFDDDAEYVIRVARIGALFDCEKVMIN